MMTHVLVAYGTRYGSTREVAETVAATLGEQGMDTDVMTAREVRSLDGYDAVVLGTPLYMGALQKDVRALLEKNREALEHTPFALFALGPINADDGVDGSRAQLIEALAKLPVPTPPRCRRARCTGRWRTTTGTGRRFALGHGSLRSF
jgi:menaquinone-dependent protoporphyrinogen oxidase